MKIEIHKDAILEPSGEGWKETWYDEQGRKGVRYWGHQPPEVIQEMLDELKGRDMERDTE